MKKNNAKHTIAMSGSTGFVGSKLNRFFEKHKWSIVPLGRNVFKSGIDQLAEKMKDADIIVNLAGAPVIGRWTEEYKKIMYESRINISKGLVKACSKFDRKPKVLISASAVGYYASGGPHTEQKHRKDRGFLGHMAQDWEREVLEAEKIGIRTIIFRFGIVLGRGGGALQQMITPFKLGLGGMIGDGSQPFSWIHMNDLIQAYEAAIEDDAYSGIYNLTAPNPTTNKGLTEALGKALGRPTMLRIPEFVLRMRYGEGAEMLSSGQEVVPERLIEKGFRFQFTEIQHAVNDCVE
jgi:uncharacterized protein (TIGR01777 family)